MKTVKNNIQAEKRRKTLSFKTKLAYGVGHFYNDICAAMWATYFLIFFSNVEQLGSALSGDLHLLGQIADGLATPFIGYFSDRITNDRWICKFGRRKIWHLIGSIGTFITYPMVFSPCPGCEHSATWVQVVYYGTFITLLQICWASVQIAHLSLVPDLTPDKHERTSLLAYRNVSTVVSAILVYILFWIVLSIRKQDANLPITSSDAPVFQIVAILGGVIGIALVIVFHAGVKEESHLSVVPNLEQQQSTKPTPTTNVSILGILLQLKFYQVATLYMASRVFANISQTMFPLYLHNYLKLRGQFVAILPLVMNIFGFLISLFIKSINKIFGRKIAYSLSAAVGIAVSIWVLLDNGYYYKTYYIYLVAGLFGISSSALLVTSLGVTADLIGQDVNNGALIYGLMSFCDKISFGAVVTVIQYWQEEWGYRNSLVYACGGSALLGAVVFFTLKEFKDNQEDENQWQCNTINEEVSVSRL